jgi:hypothetical protein
MTDIKAQGSVNAIIGSGEAGVSIKNKAVNTSMFSNTTRHLSGHHLGKLSTGSIDITTGAQDMVKF